MHANLPIPLSVYAPNLTIARSLEDYGSKMQTTYSPERYAEPLRIFWERDRNDVLSPIAADFACHVRALIDLAKAMEERGEIHEGLLPRLWNETHKTT